MVTIKCYWHRYDQYVAFITEHADDGTITIEYTLEFDNGVSPCYIKKKIKKLDKAFEFMCDIGDYDKKTKRPKKTKSVCKSTGSKDDI